MPKSWQLQALPRKQVIQNTKGDDEMETTVKASLQNAETIRAALDKADNKLAELREALDELEKIELDILIDHENASQDTAERKEERLWKTPRLTIDKYGIWLGDVHLPTVTHFALKNNPSNDGTFTLDIELEVTL